MLHEKRPVPGNSAHIFGITLLFLILAGGGFWGLFSALETGDGRWLALLFTAGAGVVVAGWRIKQHDARAWVLQERVQVKRPEPEPEVKNIHVFTKLAQPGGGRLDVGKFAFSEGQWYALKNTIIKCGGKMVRDPIRKARPHIFEPVDMADWQGILNEFKRMNLIDEKNFLTSAGEEFFNSDPFARRNYSPTPVAEDTGNLPL